MAACAQFDRRILGNGIFSRGLWSPLLGSLSLSKCYNSASKKSLLGIMLSRASPIRLLWKAAALPIPESKPFLGELCIVRESLPSFRGRNQPHLSKVHHLEWEVDPDLSESGWLHSSFLVPSTMIQIFRCMSSTEQLWYSSKDLWLLWIFPERRALHHVKLSLVEVGSVSLRRLA